MNNPPSDHRPAMARTQVMAMLNGKGGTGKTTLVMGLAAEAATARPATNEDAGHPAYRVLLVDTDPLGVAYDLSKAIEDPGYDVVHELDPQQLAQMREAGYDRIFVDTPGSLEGEQVLAQVLDQADYVVIPYDHKPPSRGPTLATIEYVTKRGVPYRVLLNAIDWRQTASYIQAAWGFLDAHDAQSFATFIRRYEAWPNAQDQKVTILRYRGGMAAKAREDLGRVASRIERDLAALAVRG